MSTGDPPELLLRDGGTGLVVRAVGGVLRAQQDRVALPPEIVEADVPAAVLVRPVVDTVKSVDAGSVSSVAHRDRLREEIGPYVVDAGTLAAVAAVPGAADDPVAALLSLDVPTLAVLPGLDATVSTR